MPQIQVFLSEDNQISHDLADEKVTVGRLADNALQIDDGSVSSHHAEIIFENGKYLLRDLGSTNGTFVNNEQVTEVVLSPGDEVRFGRIPSLFKTEEEAGGAAPLPASAGAPAAVAQNSARPANFVSSSPVPRGKKGKDTLGMALYALAVVAIVAGGAAAYFVSALQAS